MSKHLKRLAAPIAMRVSRKNYYWVVKPGPGAHPLRRSVPLLVLLRDHLGLAATAREAKAILGDRQVKVDGRVVTDERLPVGLMDVVAIEKTQEYYRILIDYRGRLVPLKISKEDAKWKLCRVEGRRTIKGGVTQYNLHDGRNVQTTKAKYRPGDTLQLELPEQKVVSTFELKEGATALIISGTHTGEVAKVASLETIKSSRPNIVKFAEGISTVFPNVFIVGRTKPEVPIAQKVVV